MFDPDAIERVAAARRAWEADELRQFLERQPEPRAQDGADSPGARSPAAGGGVAGPAPLARHGRRPTAIRDPRLGQTAPPRRPPSGRSRRP